MDLIEISDIKLERDSMPRLFYAQDTIPQGQAVKETLIDFEKGNLAVTEKGGDLLKKLDKDENCNLVFIFGNARSGKSFMMNCLVGARGLFQVANTATPCTKGVDVSSYLAKHSALVEHVKSYASVEEVNKGPDSLIGFVDVEGQGAEDGTYDTMLALPLLLTSKVVLFNHKGAPTISHMLSQLGVLARAAEYIDLAEEGEEEEEEEKEEGGPKKFGHLHVLFRDFSFEGEIEDVMEQLMAPEKVPKRAPLNKRASLKSAVDPAKAVKERNDIRQLLKENFASINVWLFKQPAEADVLMQNSEVPEEAIDPEFTATVKQLIATMAGQLSTPTLFSDRPLSGPRIHQLISQVATQLNEGGAINVPSVFRAMEKETLLRVASACLEGFRKAIAALKGSLPVGREALEKKTGEAQTEALSRFDEELKGCMLEEDKKIQRKELDDNTSKLKKQLETENNDILLTRIKQVVSQRMLEARSAFDEYCVKNMPVKEQSSLDKAFAEAKKAALKGVAEDLKSIDKVAKTDEFKVTLLEAEEGLQEFLTLKTIQNESAVKDRTIQALHEEAIKQQETLIEQNKKLQEFLDQEKGATEEMEAEMERLKKEQAAEETRAKEAKERMELQQKEMEELRKKRKKRCTIL